MNHTIEKLTNFFLFDEPSSTSPYVASVNSVSVDVVDSVVMAAMLISSPCLALLPCCLPFKQFWALCLHSHVIS